MPWKQKSFGWGRSQLGLPMLPDASDATVKALREVQGFIDSGASIGHVVFEVETVEPPSVQLAVELMLDRVKSKLKFDWIVASIPSPNPQKSMAAHPLWKFRFGKPRPALAKPSAVVSRICVDVVRQSHDCFDSWRCAQERSNDLVFDQIPSLLSLMVHPPAIQDGSEPSDWLRRVQLAAAQLATWVEMNQGVVIAESRVADVVEGPLDWSIDSALFALTQRAQEETEISDSVLELARKLLTRIPTTGTWSCREVAVGVMSYLESESIAALSSSRESAPPV